MRLLRKRLKGVSSEQVDLGDLTLTHFKANKACLMTSCGSCAAAKRGSYHWKLAAEPSSPRVAVSASARH